MNHNGDKSPSMDLDELLRRHDQFKQRQAHTPGPAARPHAPAQRPVIKRPAPVETPAAEEPAAPIPAEPAVEETPFQAAPVEDVAVEPEAVPDVFVDDAEVIDDPSDDESAYSDEDYDEAESEREPNPFDSMFSVFRSAFGKLHRKKGSDDEEFYEDEFENEVFDESSEPDMPEGEASESSAESEPVQENVPAAPVEDIEDIASIEDVEDLSASEPLDNDFADDFDDEELDAQSEKKKGLLGWLKKKKNVEEDESYAFDDSDYAEDDYVAEEFPDKEECFPEDMPAESIDFENEPAQAADMEDLADLADLPAGDSSNYSAPAFDEDDFEEDEEYGEEVADPSQPSGLRRFLNLFIVREDDDAETSDEEDNWNEDDWTDDSFEGDGWNEYDRPEDNSCTDTRFAADDRHSDPTGAMDSAPSDFRLFRDAADIEGGTIDMDEKNRVNTDMTELLATGLESQGMSRRERRELAARLAAEEAALRAAETSSVAEDAPAETPEVIAEAPESEKLVTDSFGIPDEPTRIFKPLSSFSRPIEESSPAAEPAPIEPDDEEDFDDEEEDEDKHSRFSLFRKKHAEKDDEDDEDFDEDDEDFDEDDEDDEPVEKKPRRSLFAKKSRSIKYDEDEEELDEEDDSFDNDEDDEDEYDEYDDFDDEYDDEDYDDEDDDLNDGRPLGIRIVGFFKGLFAFVLCVLIVVFALNFLDYFNVLSLDSVFEHHYNKAPAVFDTLFPSHNLKKLIKPDETIEAIVPEPTMVSDSVTPVPDAVQVTEAPVSVTPVPEAAQATETPAVG